MRLLDEESGKAIKRVLLVLTPGEAAELRDGLSDLLASTKPGHHVHVSSEDYDRELTLIVHRSGSDKSLDERVVKLIDEGV